MTEAEKERAAVVWRNGVTNTVCLIDHMRKKHAKMFRRSKQFADFDRELDDLLQKWMDVTRTATPTDWEGSEALWKQFRGDHLTGRS